MQKIKIIYNKESFNFEPNIEWLYLESTFKFNDKIIIKSSSDKFHFDDRDELIKVFEKIRGTDINNLKLKFYELNFHNLAQSSFFEQQAFKSLTLIYHWLDLSLSNPKDLDVKTILYNEFIVDWNFTPGTQNSIYLIDEYYIQKSEYQPLLEKLLEVNLLCKLEVITENKNFTNYFIPLLTPGVSIDYFKSESDNDGLKANKLWKSLLNDKNKRISNWVNKRF